MMSLRKSLSLLVLLCFFANGVQSSPAGLPLKFIDYLVQGSGLTDILARQGIVGESAATVQSSIQNSLRAFSSRGGDISGEELKSVLESLSVTGDDAVMRNQLLELLNRSGDELSSEDVATAINSLIYLADSRGVRGFVARSCSTCVDQTLVNRGIVYTFATVQDETTNNVLETVVPRGQRELTTFIQRRMSNMNIGNFNRVPRELIPAEDQRALGLFLAMAEHGTPTQKEFVQAVLEFSKKSNGQVSLLDVENPHTFWRLFIEDKDSDFLSFYAQLLREAASEEPDFAAREDAFYRVFTRVHEDNPVALRQIDELKTKGCLFR
jgi:hypothetical protein